MQEEKEIWRNISGYPNYQVSNKGRVKSLSNDKTRKEKILKPIKHKNGYLIINLCKNGKFKHMKVHRLVAVAFVQNNSLFNTEINHLDENKENNCASNLEWCEHIHNINFGTRNERAGKAVSKANTNNPKFSKKVICIETGKIYPSLSDVHRKLGFNQGYICLCCNGKFKQAYGYHWRYVD